MNKLPYLILSYFGLVATILQFYFGIPNLPSLLKGGSPIQIELSNHGGATAISVFANSTSDGKVFEPTEATVALDGGRVGNTPLIEFPITATSHHVQVTKPDFIAEQVRFSSEEGRLHSIEFVLYPKTAEGARLRQTFIDNQAEKTQFSTWRGILLIITVLPFGLGYIGGLIFDFPSNVTEQFGKNGLIMILAVFAIFPISVSIGGIAFGVVTTILAGIVNFIFAFRGYDI